MSEFTEAVERNLEGLEAVSAGPCPGCAECGLEDCDSMEDERYELASEPSFSWSSCDCCGSSLGGDRHPAHYWADPERGEDGRLIPHTGYIAHMDVCTDCLLYLANGDEPDDWR